MAPEHVGVLGGLARGVKNSRGEDRRGVARPERCDGEDASNSEVISGRGMKSSAQVSAPGCGRVSLWTLVRDSMWVGTVDPNLCVRNARNSTRSLVSWVIVLCVWNIIEWSPDWDCVIGASLV
jgi:hypothetical protein